MSFQIVPERKRPTVSQQFGQAFSNLGQAAGQAIPQYLKDQSQTAKLKEKGIDVAGISDPGLRQMLVADELQRGRKLQKSQFKSGLGASPSAQDAKPVSKELTERKEEVVPAKKRKKEAFAAEKFFEEGGQLPQQSTRDQPKPVYSGDEIRAVAQQNSAQAAAQGIDYPVEEAEEDLNRVNRANADYNQQIKLEQVERREAQRDYGDRAVSKLDRLVPNASDEVKSYFRKIGERAASAGKSEAAVDEIVSKEAKDYKNALNSIDKSLKPARTLRKLGRFFSGGERDIEKQITTLRNQVKPLLDRGLYDVARAQLADKGWYPEEVETIIDSMEGSTKQIMATLPSIPKVGTQDYTKFHKEKGYNKFQTENYPQLYDSLKESLVKNPDENLILLRKTAEDKGYDWKTFKQAMTELISSGEIELEQDSMNQLNRINEPPLYLLDQLAYDFGFGGK